jgi:shikimate kinase
MNIILIGYMGSGKTSVGKKLSDILDCKFIDLDHFIELKEKMSISEVFNNKGEIYFRKMENFYLLNLLNVNDNRVLALGGGTPCYANNMNAIKNASNTKSIYLKASINSLVQRLEPELNKRPLITHLKSKDELSEFIGKHLFERSYYYSQSDFLITTDNKSIDEIIEDIILELF